MKRFLGILAILLGLPIQSYAQEAIVYTKMINAVPPVGSFGNVYGIGNSDADNDSIFTYLQGHGTIAGVAVYAATKVKGTSTAALTAGQYSPVPGGKYAASDASKWPFQVAAPFTGATVSGGAITLAGGSSGTVLGANITDTVPIAHGGTQSKTRQAAIDTLSNVSRATTGWILTDSSSHAVWQVAAGGGAAFTVAGSTNHLTSTASYEPIQSADANLLQIAAPDVSIGYLISKACTVSLFTGTLDAAAGTSNGDTLTIYMSTDHGATWAATTSSLAFSATDVFKNDATHTISCAQYDLLAIRERKTAGSSSGLVAWGAYITIP